VVFVCATLIFFHHSYVTKCICYELWKSSISEGLCSKASHVDIWWFWLSGNPAHAENLRVVLLSRDPTNLRSELSSNKKVCCRIFWSVVLQAICQAF
jgi:hypothetical protein